MGTKSPVKCLILITCLMVSSNLWAQEQSVPLPEVPAAAIAAAEAAVEGLQITSAEVEVTSDGQVLEVETDD